MDRKEKAEYAKRLMQHWLNEMEWPEGGLFRDLAKEQGYLYLRLTIEDVNTGNQITQPIYTIRKPEDLKELFNELLEVFAWPKDFLKQYKTPFWVNDELWISQKADAAQVLDKKIWGGRPEGKSETQIAYETEIAIDFLETKEYYKGEGLPRYTYEEFVGDRLDEYPGLNEHTLKRYVLDYKNRMKKTDQ